MNKTLRDTLEWVTGWKTHFPTLIRWYWHNVVTQCAKNLYRLLKMGHGNKYGRLIQVASLVHIWEDPIHDERFVRIFVKHWKCILCISLKDFTTLFLSEVERCSMILVWPTPCALTGFNSPFGASYLGHNRHLFIRIIEHHVAWLDETTLLSPQKICTNLISTLTWTPFMSQCE